jgi:hypothetical protein
MKPSSVYNMFGKFQSKASGRRSGRNKAFRERLGHLASPSAAILDSQSAAEKGR